MLEVYVWFGTEAVYILEKANIALISTARRRWALDPAQLIKIMQLLQRRHPEIRMGVELLIEPGRSALMDSDTQEIGSRTVGVRAVPFLMFAVAGATIEWPNPPHARLSPFRHRETT